MLLLKLLKVNYLAIRYCNVNFFLFAKLSFFVKLEKIFDKSLNSLKPFLRFTRIFFAHMSFLTRLASFWVFFNPEIILQP